MKEIDRYCIGNARSDRNYVASSGLWQPMTLSRRTDYESVKVAKQPSMLFVSTAASFGAHSGFSV